MVKDFKWTPGQLHSIATAMYSDFKANGLKNFEMPHGASDGENFYHIARAGRIFFAVREQEDRKSVSMILPKPFECGVNSCYQHDIGFWDFKGKKAFNEAHKMIVEIKSAVYTGNIYGTPDNIIQQLFPDLVEKELEKAVWEKKDE